MRYLKLYEEISQDVLRRAANALYQKGHQKRYQELIGYSNLPETERHKKLVILSKDGLATSVENIYCDIEEYNKLPLKKNIQYNGKIK